ncbi:hypothetical protein CRUP_001275 [Coryphaenoides rupestris]|nr:hypothetical protein CRUP_001275 [Coryphaenoides rupestris]
MAFRACHWAVRRAVRVSGPPGGLMMCLTAGAAAPSRRGNRLGSFSPVYRFITSDAFLNRLAKGKVAELDDSRYQHHRPPSVPPDSGGQLSLLVREPDQPETPRVLRVAVLGSPNAGKSTLSNQLLGRKVFAVSKKVHTTRSKALAVLTEDATQIILLDTPGLTTPSKVKRHNLEESLLSDPWSSVKEADLLLVMVDVADRWACGRLDREVLKTDLVKNKSKLLDVTAHLTCGVVNGHKLQVRRVVGPHPRVEDTPPPPPPDNSAPPGSSGESASEGSDRSPVEVLSKEQLKQQQGWPHFRDVFMVSSVDPADVDTLKRYLVVEAKPGPWQYHSEVLTDQAPEEVCANIIREKLLEYLNQEVPYSMTQKMVIGPGGQMVARIAREAGEDMSAIFLREVKLRLSVKLQA